MQDAGCILDLAHPESKARRGFQGFFVGIWLTPRGNSVPTPVSRDEGVKAITSKDKSNLLTYLSPRLTTDNQLFISIDKNPYKGSIVA